MEKNTENKRKIFSIAKGKFLAPLLVCTGLGLIVTSCGDDGDRTVPGESAVELTPEGPAPDWAPNITDPMLVVIEEFQSYNVPPLQTLSPQEARQQPRAGGCDQEGNRKL
ncbi:hypothetical protein [Pricia sp.]|uniref:hypothetical protein n=1 Tax=Pricia sp. TaxID=2268138 RepID=UPI003592F77D